MRPIIVYAYICGDILHRGHLLYLQNALAFGDILIVGVLTDEAIAERKPKPVMSFEERLNMVLALEYVNIAVPQTTYSPVNNIRIIRPDVLIESESHDGKMLEEVHNEMARIGGYIQMMPYYPVQSSAKIKEEIRHE